MFRTFQIPLTWTELIKRTAREASSDNCLGLAAQLSYYFLLALVPAILCVVALASFIPVQVVHDLIARMGAVVPADIVNILREQLQNVSNGRNRGIFTVGMLMAIWSSSAAVVGIIDALNRAYDIEEARPWWKVRLTAITLTLGVAVFVVVAFGLVMIGPTLADQVASRLGLGAAFALGWKILQWPIVFALIVVVVGVIFYFGPDAEQDWEWVTPGAVLGTVLWLVASLGFKIYVTNFANYNESYGSLGGVIVLMLWFYVSSLAILIGAEMNAEIEHASPHGKAPGEKVPGEKRKLGAAAQGPDRGAARGGRGVAKRGDRREGSVDRRLPPCGRRARVLPGPLPCAPARGRRPVPAAARRSRRWRAAGRGTYLCPRCQRRPKTDGAAGADGLRRQQLLERAVAVGLEQLAEAAERPLADQDLGEGHLAGERHQRGAPLGVLREVDLPVVDAARLQQRLRLPAKAAGLGRVEHDPVLVRHPVKVYLPRARLF